MTEESHRKRDSRHLRLLLVWLATIIVVALAIRIYKDGARPLKLIADFLGFKKGEVVGLIIAALGGLATTAAAIAAWRRQEERKRHCMKCKPHDYRR